MKTSFLRILSPVLWAGLASLTLVPDTRARVFVATNSTWRYFKGTNEASDPTNAWRELEFDDSAWLVGPAPFHFGTNAVGGYATTNGSALAGSDYEALSGTLTFPEGQTEQAITVPPSMIDWRNVARRST